MLKTLFSKAQQALEIAQKAVHWYEDDKDLNDDELLANARRCVGIGYSLLAAEGHQSSPNYYHYKKKKIL